MGRRRPGMRTFLLTFLGGLAALVVFFVLIPLVLIMSFIPSGEPPRAHNAVLEIDLRDSGPDQPASDAINAVFSGTSFVETLIRLNAAADDPDVKGVFVRAAESNLGRRRRGIAPGLLRLRPRTSSSSPTVRVSSPRARPSIAPSRRRTRSGCSPAHRSRRPASSLKPCSSAERSRN